MTEQQFTDEFEAPEADAAEQSLPVAAGLDDAAFEDAAFEGARPRVALLEPETSLEVDPADAAEQAVPVPLDEDEYR